MRSLATAVAVIALGALPFGVHADDLIEEALKGTGLDPCDVSTDEGPDLDDILVIHDEWFEECGEELLANLKRLGASEASIISGPDLGLAPDSFTDDTL